MEKSTVDTKLLKVYRACNGLVAECGNVEKTTEMEIWKYRFFIWKSNLKKKDIPTATSEAYALSYICLTDYSPTDGLDFFKDDKSVSSARPKLTASANWPDLQR